MTFIQNHPRPLVALVGRTNVGKSTLWNTLTESGRALVSAEPHTTRDRNFGTVVWRGRAFDVVDTGGMDTEPNDMGHSIRHQAELAIKQADLVLFLFDAQAGVLPQDQTLAKSVKALNPRVIPVANKVDRINQLALATEPAAFKLNLGEPFPASAATSFGVGDLLDRIERELEEIGKSPVSMHELEPLRIVIIGRPNVGKSSLANSILGFERVIVSPVAHTTREPQDTSFTYKDRDLVLVDTAGMRARAKIKTDVEEGGIERNERAIRAGDIALLVLDATEPPTAQDRHLAGMIEEAHKGLMIVANKWDLVENKKTFTAAEYEKLIRQSLPFLDWAPLVFVSALSGQRTKDLLDLALKVQDERHRHIDYNALNRQLKSAIQAKKPLQSYGPKSPRIYDAAQIDHAPPTFLITVHGEKENLHPSWLKFFEKRLRAKFGFTGTPIVVKVRHLPVAKTQQTKNVHGPGMEAVAGKIKEKKRLVNQTMRRQKHGGRRY